MQIAAAIAARFETARAFELQIGFGRRRKIGRATDDPRHARGNRVEYLARRFARRDALRVCVEARDIAVPTLRQFMGFDLREFAREFRILLLISVELRLPLFARSLA